MHLPKICSSNSAAAVQCLFIAGGINMKLSCADRLMNMIRIENHKQKKGMTQFKADCCAFVRSVCVKIFVCYCTCVSVKVLLYNRNIANIFLTELTTCRHLEPLSNLCYVDLFTHSLLRSLMYMYVCVIYVNTRHCMGRFTTGTCFH